MENAGPGSRGQEVPGCGKRGVWWKTRGPVKNAGHGGKRGVRWKTRGLVENAGSGGKVPKCRALVFFWGVYFVFRSKNFVWEKN